MRLFNRDNEGAAELVAVLGLTDGRLNFEKWKPIVPMGVRDLQSIIGSEAVNAIDSYYQGGGEQSPSAAMDECVTLAQQAAAMFAWLRVIPTLEAQHGTAGRGKRLGENEKGLTAAQEFKDEENIRNMAYEAVDALVELMDNNAFEWWTATAAYQARRGLLIPDRQTFDRFYVIGSHRLFLTLTPMIREVQDTHIIPIITRARYEQIIAGDTTLRQVLLEACQRPLALLTIKKAVERLPIEVLPMGIVQVQQQATVRDKLRAEKSARDAVASALADDAALMLDRLADIIHDLDNDTSDTDPYIPGPTLQSRGITF